MAAKEKLVDKWVYKYVGVEDPDQPGDGADAAWDDGDAPPRKVIVGDRIVEVEVRLSKETRDSEAPPHPLSTVSFVVVCKEPKFRFVGTDIEALRRAAWAELDKAFAIKWTPWLLVSLTPTRYHSDPGKGMQFTHKTVEKGIAHDGTELLREFTFRSERKVSPWPGRFRDDNGNVMACIEATEANREAMEQFEKGVDALRKRIADYLRPENIDQTLLRLSNQGFAGAIAGPVAAR